MPIARQNRHLYRTPGWFAARRRVLERAGGKFDEHGNYLGGARCEQCRKPDRSHVYVYTFTRSNGQRIQYWAAATSQRWRDCWGAILPRSAWPAAGLPRRIWAEIGVAHRNQKAGDDRPENLAAWCQFCHWHHDLELHNQHARETRCTRKDRARPILELAS